jgi:uncharacterized protein (DUF1330 family)
MEVRNALLPTGEQLSDHLAAAGDGPIVMVNLLRFRRNAAYADGSEPELSGAEAYQRYAVAVSALVRELGGRIVYAGAVDGVMIGHVEEGWHMVALAEYPSAASMIAMATSPAYAAIAHHRDAGLEGQLNIRTWPRAEGA